MIKVTHCLVLSLLLMMIGCSSVLSTHQQSKAINPQSSVNMLKGIDISHYQGNFVTELAGSNTLDFVICKATQGLTYVDGKFLENWNMLKSEGHIRGAYHFYDAKEDGRQQALHFINTVGDISDADITPVVDIEGASLNNLSDQTTVQKIALIEKGMFDLLNTLHKHYGRKPIVYTNYTFAQKYLVNKRFSEYPLWLAQYTSAHKPKVPNVWLQTGFKIWQKSDSYKLDSTDLDFDVFYGTRKQLLE